MKCKHGIEAGTCSLCLGYRQSERGQSGLPDWFCTNLNQVDFEELAEWGIEFNE